MIKSLFSGVVAVLAVTAAAIFCVVAFFVVFVHQQVPAAPSTRSVEIGHVRYEAVQGRPLDPLAHDEAPLVAGVPRAALRARHGQIFYAVFLGVSNDTAGPLPLASGIELRDERGDTYAPINLPPANPFAYDRREIGGRSRLPAATSAPAGDLEADGSLLLYRIPARDYQSALEVEIHDPLDPGAVASLTV